MYYDFNNMCIMTSKKVYYDFNKMCIMTSITCVLWLNNMCIITSKKCVHIIQTDFRPITVANLEVSRKGVAKICHSVVSWFLT